MVDDRGRPFLDWRLALRSVGHKRASVRAVDELKKLVCDGSRGAPLKEGRLPRARLKVSEHALAAVAEADTDGQGPCWGPPRRNERQPLGEIHARRESALNHALRVRECETYQSSRRRVAVMRGEFTGRCVRAKGADVILAHCGG